ncbi:hypothetical protein TNCV_3754331 [Trichonephila clavipes]|nr:hypothetical protein TNCV_3754331 [Trichonephila clavipes]
MLQHVTKPDPYDSTPVEITRLAATYFTNKVRTKKRVIGSLGHATLSLSKRLACFERDSSLGYQREVTPVSVSGRRIVKNFHKKLSPSQLFRDP